VNRAVSDTLGFVFVFALVTASVGVVYTSGIDGLRDARQSEQLRNMERAFDVIDENLRDVHAEGAPSRASEIKLPGGTIEFLNPVEIEVQTNATRADGAGCSGGCAAFNNSTTADPVPIAYTDGDTRIVYAAGAVFRTDGDRTAMLSEPGWVVDDERALVRGIETDAVGDRTSLGGDTTVLLVAREQSRAVAQQVRTGSEYTLTVNVTVRTVRADAWNRYFEARGFDTEYDAEANVVSAEFETERVYVSKTDIAVEIER